MTYNESNKTHYGIDSRENSQEQRMYANHENTAICPAASLDYILQPLQYPKANLWYAAQPVGKNKLAGMMARISSAAGLSKRHTNHCIEATVATGLKQRGVDLLSILSITGHRNVKSLDSYIEGPSDSDCRKIRSVLQNLGQDNTSSSNYNALTSQSASVPTTVTPNNNTTLRREQ
ncbi:KCTD1_15 [Mytilus coruscus]|uniref:KCTD1_15 n=1 Tax=Mytilus coruscus TaxID=42192 RepID=A0A6J8AMT1_MYTCO|nr:KCTD1_15 [Mytilus coruscus]